MAQKMGWDAVSSLACALGGFHGTCHIAAPPGPQAEVFACQPWDAAGAAGTAAVLAVPPAPLKAGWHAVG